MKKLWIENIENFPARVFEENAPNEDFIDKSNDLLEWYKSKDVLDWFLRREKITPLFYNLAGLQLENFLNLSNEIKLIACELFLIPYTIRIQIISEEQDKINFLDLLSKSKRHRQECIEKMRLMVGERMRTGQLTLQQCQDFFLDVSESIYRYEETNLNEFKDFIFNTTGVFETKNYYSESLKNALVDIYTGENW